MCVTYADAVFGKGGDDRSVLRSSEQSITTPFGFRGDFKLYTPHPLLITTVRYYYYCPAVDSVYFLPSGNGMVCNNAILTHGVLHTMNTISRPTVTIIASPSGKKFGINITADSWKDDYQMLRTFTSAEEANSIGEQFAKVWDQQATLMESGELPRSNMLQELTANGICKSRSKLRDAFAQFGNA